MGITKNFINRSNLVEKIDIPEDSHGFYGLGDMLVVFKIINNEYYLHTYFKKHDIKIVLTGTEAYNAYLSHINGGKNGSLNLLINIACDVTGVNTMRLYKKGRTVDEIIHTRYLVYWFVRKYMKRSFTKVGIIFGQDHATALRAFNMINDADKKFDYKLYNYREKFIEKVKKQAPYLFNEK